MSLPVAPCRWFAWCRSSHGESGAFGALKGMIAVDARFDEPLPENELGGWKFT